MEMLYSKSYSGFVLGSLLNDTNLMYSTKYPLCKQDFSPFLVHKIIFVCISILCDHGVHGEIQPKDIAEVLKNYPEEENAIKGEIVGNYLDYIDDLKKLDNQATFDFYYQEVRKRSLLREYRDNGYSITEIYDETKSQESQDKKLSQKTIKDIIDYFDKPQAIIKNKYLTRDNEEQYIAGSDFAQTKKELSEAPLVGDSFMSPYFNEVLSGIYGFIMRVAKSGSGKTSESVGDTCTLSATHMYNEQTKQFEVNQHRAGNTMFINTEMDLRKELDIMFVACISGVERMHIRRNEYDVGEEERVDKAGEILKNSGIYVVDMPEFTTRTLTERIEEYVRMYDIKNVVFDYVQNNGFVAKEISSETKVPQREDMVLLALTERLKQIQRKENVGLLSSVQTNGVEDELTYPTERVMAGGKSQIRKLDGCICILPMKPEEAKFAEMWMNEQAHKGHRHLRKPNCVAHLLKGRGTAYEKHIKMYQYLDNGTCRYYDCFATDKDNNPINITGLNILGNEVIQ
jgi:replicative DNA helicase